ncbi:TPR-like protein [Mycena rebaudengoi]|nr:TPR-like protein [Mycena rebaudengoi]
MACLTYKIHFLAFKLLTPTVMSKLRTVIQLHSDMKMFAQLIVEDNIFLQTLPVASEQDQMSWKLSFGVTCAPLHAQTFSVTILRQSETEGTRFLGYVEIGRGEVLGSIESNSLAAQVQYCESRWSFSQIQCWFSVTELPYQEVSGLDLGAWQKIQVPLSRVMASESYQASGNVDDVNQAVYLGRSLRHRFERCGRLPDINQSVMLLEAAVERTLQGDSHEPSRLNDLGNSLLRRFERLGGLDDLNQSTKPSLLNNLGNSLLGRFERLGGLDDLNQSVLRFEAAVTLTPDGHPDKPSWLNNLGNSLLGRFERLGGLDDLNQSVLRKEAAVTLTPDGHPSKPSRLNNLGNSLLGRFERLGGLDDLNQSVLRFEAAVTLTPDGHPSKPSLLNNLGNSLLGRFERLGGLDDLNQRHPDKPSWLNNLGNSLLGALSDLVVLDDLNQSVLRKEAAVTLTPDGHPSKPSRLNNLGNSLLRRFERLGGLDDLNQSTATPSKPSLLNNLGNSLLGRFERLGGLDDLNQSVLRKEAAVTLTPDGHPDKPSRLNNLGNSLLGRFERLGGLDDLNQSSVLRFEAAVTLTPDGHPDKPSRLNNLGNSLLRRFERLGGLDDLNQSSVLRKEAAVTLTPDGHPSKPSRLNNLGNHSLAALSDLVVLMISTNGHPDKPSLLNNLGNSLLGRFERLGGLDDLNQSVLRFEAAVTLTPDGHPSKPSLLNNLGNSLLGRFERLGGLDDLNQFEAAVTLTPDGHPDKPSRLNNLGNSLLGRFERLGGLDDLNQSVLRFEAAVTLTPAGHQTIPHSCVTWGIHCTNALRKLHDPQDSQQLLLHYTQLHAQQQALQASDLMQPHGQVVRDAASAAIGAHDYKKAVEWLDQGRSVIWGQLLNLRTPVDELRKSHPGLADRLVSLSTLLETAGTPSNPVADTLKPESLDSIAKQSHALVLERNQVLQQIRELPGFERFLLSKPTSELSLAARMGPIAILNISAYGCDALILMPGLGNEVIHVPLSDFTIHEAQVFAKVLASIVGTPGRSDRLFGFQEGYMAPDDIFSHILSVLWFKIVHPILNALAITKPVRQDLGHIWWCPTGPLVFLPIHAAGVYGEDQAFGSKLSDFLISSYTPSLTALIEGFRPHTESQEELQLLAVTQPSAVGQSYLPGTQEEIKFILQQVAGKKVQLQWLDEEMATIDEVQEGMTNSRWVHFACHGVQSDSPTESALLLAGRSRLTLSNIIQLNLPNADLAFLSACQTATGSQELQDESVHLTAGMLLAGYRGVIGTMWSIDDNDAPQVAGDVYAHLLEVSPPDPTRAAQALHLAVQRLREQPGARKSFLHWVPFIHFGV